ncbi:hypothetical protein LZ31DRAFT_128243 [Colletotrichum somersetense]|nr:hypothetical protein LZ31DRAFT_128243 [Colletotrichum somersetense]
MPTSVHRLPAHPPSPRMSKSGQSPSKVLTNLWMPLCLPGQKAARVELQVSGFCFVFVFSFFSFFFFSILFCKPPFLHPVYPCLFVDEGLRHYKSTPRAWHDDCGPLRQYRDDILHSVPASSANRRYPEGPH